MADGAVVRLAANPSPCGSDVISDPTTGGRSALMGTQHET